MPKGKVESINVETKKAVIGGKEVQLNKNFYNKQVNPTPQFEVGDMIEFNMKGANFEFLKKLPGNNNAPTAKPAGAVPPFSYPYNFISLEGKVEKKPREKGNISGIMECEITTHSPMLIGGGEKKVTNGHPTESFYKENGEYLIPASGVKGAIRNVFDTVTNSCIRGVEEERLEKRLGAGAFNNRKFGIITKLPTDDAPGVIVEADMIKITNSNQEGFALPSNMQKEGIYTEFFSDDILKYANPKLTVVNGKKCYDKTIKTSSEYNSYIMKKEGTKGRKGIVWVTSKIGMKTHDKILIAKSDAKEYKFTKDDYKDLKYLISQRDERDIEDPKKGKEFYFEKEIKAHENEKELKPWYDPIVFDENKDGSMSLAFSEIPRLRYKLSPKDLIPDSHISCRTNESLCPSCRLFGMVDNESSADKKEELGKNNSLKGRVYFSDAKYIKGSGNSITDRLIKSLGEPHPSLARFYLTNSDGYDNGKGFIRGRKFYWHHTDKVDTDFENYYSKSLKAGSAEKHNSTINCLDKGNKFKFRLKFENLTEKELESLVYSIQLEENMLHKFGKAKAFGFGSSEVKIIHLKLDNGNVSANNFTKNYTFVESKEYVDKFINSIPAETTYWKEFRVIMSKSNKLDFSKSPFPEVERSGKTNTLNWFAQNKTAVLPRILDYER